MAQRSGIYMIKNMVNGKFYIGSSKDLYFRKKIHFRNLNNNKHCNLKLQYSYNKYGEESFEFIVVQHCEEKDLTTNEQWWLDLLIPEYNIAKVANKPVGMLGKKMSEEHKRKISETLTGRKLSLEHKENSRKTRKGLKPWNKGLKTGPLTEQDKLKKSIAAKKRWAKIKGGLDA